MPKKDIQAIDANVLLRIILNDIPEQRKIALELLLNGHRFFVSSHAIAEVVFTLERGQYKIKREVVVDNISTLLSMRSIVYDEQMIDDVFSYYLSHPKLSFVDCIQSFEVAQKEHEPIWTFDKDFAKQSPVAKELL